MASSLDTDPKYLLDIHAIVASLRDVRERSLELRQRTHRPPRLPSRKKLWEVVDGVATALFPNRLGSGEHDATEIDYFVGHNLQTALRILLDQVGRELRFNAEQAACKPLHVSCEQQAHAIVAQFAQGLTELRILLESDIDAAYRGDPAARSVDEVLVCYPGIHAVIHHRIAHALFTLGSPLVARIIAEIAHSATGIDIHPGAQIGSHFFIDHGTGVVIGETAVIGRRVRLYQAVTLGAKRFEQNANGDLLKGNVRHPIIEDDVVIYAGATLLGRITVGQGSTIGGNVWLTRSVPPGSWVTQAQVRNDFFEGGANV